MSRHRNIRSIDVDEEYDGYYSCYGHSLEDESCISPQTESEFIYNRSEKDSRNSLLNESLPEEEEEILEDNQQFLETLDHVDSAKLNSCVEAMQDVVGDSIPEEVLRKTAFQFGFDLEQALNAVLCDKAPKGQRKSPGLTSVREIETKKSDICIPTANNQLLSNSSSEIETEKNNLTAKPEKHEKINEQLESPNNENLKSVPTASDESLETEGYSYKSQKYKNAVEIYNKERGKEKDRLNLVVVGHVDAGKSTLMGHILFKLGQVSKKAMHKFEQDSKKLGKSSFMYAWVLDETPEERNRGITMDVAQTKFETSSKCVILLDAPGHRDFIPNMITGAAQADAAILVVDATKGEFETGFETGGQTREHTMLIRSLGVSQLIVAVNKMDNVEWSQERYLEIKSKLTSFLRTVGYKECDVTFVPCSGINGENLISTSDSPLSKWYHGSTIIDVIDNFLPPERPVSKPLRMCVSDVFKGMTGGICLAGRIESGFVSVGDKIVVMPAGEQSSVKNITIDDEIIHHSFAGDTVIVQFHGIDSNNVNIGSVICDPDKPIKVSSLFQARLVIFNVAVPITRGFPVILHYQSMSEQASIRKIISQLNRSTGEIMKKKPRCLTKNTSAIVEIEVNRPICIELFEDNKGLGRFMLRYAGSTVAAGLVTHIK